ncbi:MULTISPECIES: hypothetical protein [unclassified Sphingopyxis]|uniref:hypothetical protein n=1 Tax=unclassified Sphingopyxis TaxID=2614943 RepID=UPI0007376C6D|nr:MULTISPECIES: hypothetical protein [unclassified Sphingopyxis]KTE46424.1 hypothetical protein ATE62_00315 [Sphingopyxis sp. HIX]KTE85027.1 hypothetical protein ATE72_05920 [Sphingopyxis sp. HXXIV]
MVRLRNLQPLAVRGLEIAYRFEHGAAELSLEEWLLTLSDRGARLAALTDLLGDAALFDTVTDHEDAQALRIAVEVIDTVATICRDRELEVADIVAGLMGEAAMEKQTVFDTG